MKILLLNPPTREGKGFIREGRCTQEGGVWTTLWPPISLATIGAVLERDGHDVTALDGSALGYPRDQLVSDIESDPPDAVIWSTGTPSIATDLSLADEIREVAPSTRTAVFGTHVTTLDTSCLEQTPGLDAIFRNEPEATASEWVARLDDVSSWSAVAGLSYRIGDELERTADRPFLDGLDALPDPAWHLFDLDVYRLPLKGSRFLMVTPHRGCPYPCSYCTAQTYYGAKLRRRSVERVRDEIRRNVEVHGVRELFFWSDTFTLDKRYVIELCDAIEPLGVSWASNSRVDTIDPELAAAMRRAGCWMISFGIESGDQATLDRAGKGATVEDAERAVRVAKEAGIKVAGHFVLGIPGRRKKVWTRRSLSRSGCRSTSSSSIARFLFQARGCTPKRPRRDGSRTPRSTGSGKTKLSSSCPVLPRKRSWHTGKGPIVDFNSRPSIVFGALSMLSPRNLKHVGSALKRFLGWTHA